MAAPNNVLTSLIISGTESKQATTSAATLLANSAGSNRLYKVDSMIATNITGYANDVTITLVRTVTTATPPTSTSGTYNLIRASTLPGNTYIPVISKDIQLVLTEGDTIQIQASANSAINVTVCYTIIG